VSAIIIYVVIAMIASRLVNYSSFMPQVQ
jgi:hypothetical protein